MRVIVQILLLAACAPVDESDPVDDTVHVLPADEPLSLDPAVESQVDEWLSQLDLAEKVEQMHGLAVLPSDGLWLTPDNERLGIPGFAMSDGPRGVVAQPSTSFPVAMARGASWDPELERRVGAAMGLEAAAHGADVLLAPCINLLSHPSWGRAQETYGEDPHHIGIMGAAMTEGIQEHVMASAKHFAANNIENTRFEVDVTVDERTLCEVYLPHFRRVVRDARVASVMSAYNQVNGEYCAENDHLLTDILKGDWGFDGFVESDWVLGTRSTVGSALAGLDLEMPAGVYFGAELEAAVDRGEVPESTIDAAVRRLLRRKVEYGIADAVRPDASVVSSDEHLALAREVSVAGTVLLKNSVLPLSASARVVVVGALADVENLGDGGSSSVEPTSVVTPWAGLDDAFDVASLVGANTLTESDQALLAGVTAVVVVGLTHEDEGEFIFSFGGDRPDLALPADQVALIQEVASLAATTVVVLQGGSAITVEEWVDEVDALLMTFYPGQQGGHALADVLLGAEPGGRLPFSVPVDVGDLPPFDHEALAVTYPYLHGYRWLDDQGTAARFPFGFGLSYGEPVVSAASAVEALGPDDTVEVSVTLADTSGLEVSAVAQVYASRSDSAFERPPRWLVGFAKAAFTGETTVTVPVPARELAVWSEAHGGWVLEKGAYELHVGTSSS